MLTETLAVAQAVRVNRMGYLAHAEQDRGRLGASCWRSCWKVSDLTPVPQCFGQDLLRHMSSATGYLWTSVLCVQEAFVQSLLLLSKMFGFPFNIPSFTTEAACIYKQHTDLGGPGDQESHWDLRNRRDNRQKAGMTGPTVKDK